MLIVGHVFEKKSDHSVTVSFGRPQIGIRGPSITSLYAVFLLCSRDRIS